MNRIIVFGKSVPVRNNIIEGLENEENNINDGKIPLLIFIHEKAYLKLIRKCAIESMDQDEMIERLIMLLDDKHKAPEDW